MELPKLFELPKPEKALIATVATAMVIGYMAVHAALKPYQELKELNR